MKPFYVLVLFGVLLRVVDAEDRIRLVRHGEELKAKPSAVLVKNVIQLLQSASVHSTSYAVQTNTWENLLRWDSYVQVSFEKPRKLKIMPKESRIEERVPQEREEALIGEILVPLPEKDFPSHLYAKSGGRVIAVTKYDAIALRRVAFEPALSLKSSEPYSQLASLPESPSRLERSPKELE